METYKHKHLVLQDFIRILYECDPMHITFENPNGADEYESEALSILSRFNEGALQLCEDETMRREIATNLVKQSFEFWFNDTIKEPEKLAFLLLDCYIASYPQQHEQSSPDEVRSVT